MAKRADAGPGRHTQLMKEVTMQPVHSGCSLSAWPKEEETPKYRHSADLNRLFRLDSSRGRGAGNLI